MHGAGRGDHCGQSRYLKAVMHSSAALPRSWEGAIRRSERSRRPGLSWKGFRDSGTTHQGLGIQGLLGNSPKQSPHTLRSSRFKRERSGVYAWSEGAKLDSPSGRVESAPHSCWTGTWTDESSECLATYAEHWRQGSHCSRMGTAEPPALEYGGLRCTDACERAG